MGIKVIVTDDGGVFSVLNKKNKIHLEDNFIQVSHALYHDKRLNCKDRDVFAVLVAHRNQKTALCCPSIETISEITGLSIRTVKRVREKLKRLKYIKWRIVNDHCEYTLNEWFVITKEKKAPKQIEREAPKANRNVWVKNDSTGNKYVNPIEKSNKSKEIDAWMEEKNRRLAEKNTTTEDESIH